MPDSLPRVPGPSRRRSALLARLVPDPGAPLPAPPSGGEERPTRLLAWFLLRAAGPLAAATLAATASNTIQAVVPAFVGAALDSGLENGPTPRLWALCLTLLGLFVVYAAGDTGTSYYRVQAWMRTCLDTARLVGRQVSTTGAALTRQVSTGEVASVVSSDAQYLANFVERVPGVTGAAISFVVVAVLMLRTSVTLGLIVLVGMPLVSWVMTLVIKPLQRRQAHQRQAQSEVTTITTDTVAGLRILRGIGGEDVFARRYREASQELRRRGVHVAGTQSVLMSLQVLLPGLFVAVVVWAAARMAVAGSVSAGALVTFYGYTAYLSWPLMEFSNALQDYTRARVACRRLARLLAVEPAAGTVEERLTLDPATAPAHDGALADAASQVTLTPGRMTAVVAPDPEVSAALATRLGRADDAVLAGQPVTLGGLPLTALPLAQARASVVVSGATAQLFTGTLRDNLDAWGAATPQPVGVRALVRAEEERSGVADVDQDVRQAPRHADGDDRLLAALEAADAHDVLTSLDRGLAGMVTEKGRSLSGGQRQRVALARALLTEAPTLVLVEPTSALDSHTEARVAQRVRAARAGRTTVVVTESPLVLDACDEVVLLGPGGRERARSTHRDLLARARAGDADGLAYREVVARAAGADAGDGADAGAGDDAADGVGSSSGSTQEVAR